MADDVDTILRQYAPEDYRSATTGAVEGDTVNPRYTEVRQGPDQGPIQSPLGFGEPLANRLPPGTMDILAGLIGPRAPVRVPNPIRAYHGSPHDFDAFDLSKIGTGEGVQAYGHGLYFAEHEPVAQSYKQAEATLQGPKSYAQTYLERAGGDRDKAIAALKKEADLSSSGNAWSDHAVAAKLLENGWARPEGRMYEVALHASPEQFLDWDKPLAGQNQAALDALKRVRDERGPYSTAGSKTDAKWIGYSGEPRDGASLLQALGNREEAANRLREAGIPGIRYLDQGSRTAGDVASWEKKLALAQRNGDQLGIADALVGLHRAKAPTSNYVVWSPEIIEILRKYGILGPAALAAMGAATNNQTEQ